MIEKFEEGKFYIYKGKREEQWNKFGQMDFVLDGLPHKCIKSDLINRAIFEDDPVQYGWAWNTENFYDYTLSRKLKRCLEL